MPLSAKEESGLVISPKIYGKQNIFGIFTYQNRNIWKNQPQIVIDRHLRSELKDLVVLIGYCAVVMELHVYLLHVLTAQTSKDCFEIDRFTASS